MLRVRFLALFIFTSILHAEDPIREMESFSSLGRVGRNRIEAGQILSKANTSMSFARGLSIESCYLVALPVDRATEFIQSWDPSPHPELEVFKHRSFKGAADAHFEELTLAPANNEIRRLIKLTEKANSGDTYLQLNHRDIDLLHSIGSNDAAQFWTHILSDRLKRFQQEGLSGLPAYDMGELKTDAASEVASLLNENPKIGHRFADLLKELGLRNKTSPEAASYYWNLSNVNKTANLCVGVHLLKQEGQHCRMIEMVFYSSADYLLSIAFYELWPFLLEGRENTLVWRCDMTSAPALAGGLGLKREIGARFMLSDVQSTVQALQKDAAQRAKGK